MILKSLFPQPMSVGFQLSYSSVCWTPGHSSNILNLCPSIHFSSKLYFLLHCASLLDPKAYTAAQATGWEALATLSPLLSVPQCPSITKALGLPSKFFLQAVASCVSIIPLFSRQIQLCPNCLLLSNLLSHNCQNYLLKCKPNYVIHLLNPFFSHPFLRKSDQLGRLT